MSFKVSHIKGNNHVELKGSAWNRMLLAIFRRIHVAAPLAMTRSDDSISISYPNAPAVQMVRIVSLNPDEESGYRPGKILVQDENGEWVDGNDVWLSFGAY